MKKREKNNKQDNSYWLPICMCLGISIGTSISALTHNMVWLATGISIGVCLGAALSNGDDEDNKK